MVWVSIACLRFPSGNTRSRPPWPDFKPLFKPVSLLTVNEQRQVDFGLKVGDTRQEVSVEANPVEVETSNTQLGDVIDEKKIMELPLNGRSYLDLLGLQTGVAPVSSRNEGPEQYRSTASAKTATASW